ncbi:MAG: hypothetical protein OXU42_11575 [Deltaproteobacteria bacterium]|nr:hypothetical protein [Deltaproteobacteria bacterium]
MEKLKEYAGVIIAVMTVAVSLSGLVLWAIQIQIVPEIRRLDGRIESVHTGLAGRIESVHTDLAGRITGLTDRLDRMDNRINARFDQIDARFDRIDARFDRMEKRMNARFDRMDARLTRAEGDIKTILLRLPRPGDTAAARVPTPEAH